MDLLGIPAFRLDAAEPSLRIVRFTKIIICFTGAAALKGLILADWIRQVAWQRGELYLLATDGLYRPQRRSMRDLRKDLPDGFRHVHGSISS
jgi:hypothetical protein